MSEEKKIIVDEDWKSQVQAEKEAATGEPASAGGHSTQAPDADDADDMPMPPASLELLVSSLVTEALIALGQIPHPVTGQTSIRRNQAKYLIDMVTMLCERTKGNITAEEEQFFDQLLHQLRMAFVSLTSQSAETTPTETAKPVAES